MAPSRISKLENMHLIGNYDRNAIKVNKTAKKEYESLFSECLLSPLSFRKASNGTLTIALFNTRSLRRYSEDILSHIDLMQNAILRCITTLALINIEVLLLGVRVTYFSVKVQIFVSCHLQM